MCPRDTKPPARPSLKPIGYSWSYLGCRIGHVVPVGIPGGALPASADALLILVCVCVCLSVCPTCSFCMPGCCLSARLSVYRRRSACAGHTQVRALHAVRSAPQGAVLPICCTRLCNTAIGAILDFRPVAKHVTTESPVADSMQTWAYAQALDMRHATLNLPKSHFSCRQPKVCGVIKY
jgi:hypothetical protein